MNPKSGTIWIENESQNKHLILDVVNNLTQYHKTVIYAVATEDEYEETERFCRSYDDFVRRHTYSMSVEVEEKNN